MATAQEANGQYQTDTSSTASPPVATITSRNPNSSRQWRDVFWLLIFVFHLIVFGSGLGLLGANRFHKADRLNIDRFTNITVGSLTAQAAPPPPPPVATEDPSRLTETFWPFYGAAAGAGLLVAWTWLALLGRHAGPMMRVSVHGLTTYLALVSVFCFWAAHFFWGVAFAVGAALQFLYILSVIERFPFTMLVLNKSVKMVRSLPEAMGVGYAFTLLVLGWMVLWSFGVAGIVALSIDDSGRWWLLVVFSVSLFWTGAVLCNTVHVIVSGMVFLVLLHGNRSAASMPPNPLLTSLRYALSTSFGSICYGSLFTALIRTLRWEIRGVRSKIGNNECLLCCVDFLFHIVETLVRFFNKYAYVQIAVYGKSFNRSARDAWELFQSTGVEALIAYDCSGAVLLMSVILGGLITGTCTGVWVWLKRGDKVIVVGTTAMLMGMILALIAYDCSGAVLLMSVILGGLITGTCTGVWVWFKRGDKVIVVGTTAMLMGMILMGLAVVVVESAVTSIYICFAEDPNLIENWDPEFFIQLSQALHERLQYRSARARQILDNRLPDSTPA